MNDLELCHFGLLTPKVDRFISFATWTTTKAVHSFLGERYYVTSLTCKNIILPTYQSDLRGGLQITVSYYLSSVSLFSSADFKSLEYVVSAFMKIFNTRY